MTKSVPLRKERTLSKRKLAQQAIAVASFGRLIEVEVDGKPVKFWAMQEQAYATVMRALRVHAE